MAELFFWVAAFSSVVVGTVAGFGSATLFLPVALFFFDFPTALITTAILHISGNAGKLTFFKHGLDKKILLVFGLPSVVFTFAGSSLVRFAPEYTLKLIFGMFLLSFIIASFYNVVFTRTTRNIIFGGALSGFFAGLIGTGGAIRSAFLSSINLNKDVYIATTAAVSFAVDITRIPIYLSGGFSPPRLYFIPLLFLVAIMGSYSGKKVVNRIPQDTFRKFVLVALGFASAKFILDGITELL